MICFFFSDKIEKIKEIRQNIHESMYELVTHLNELGISYDSVKNHECAEYIIRIGRHCPNDMVDVI